MADFDTHRERIEEAVREYAEALVAYRDWVDAWRERQRQLDEGADYGQ